MQTYRIEVLQHTVEYDTGNVIIDADAENIVYDMIYECIFDNESKGIGVLELEDDKENPINVDVSWKIINPEVNKLREDYQQEWDQREAHYRKIYKEKEDEVEQWKRIAGKLYYALITETAGNLDREDKTIAAIQEYELLKGSENGK